MKIQESDDWDLFVDHRRFRQSPAHFVREFHYMMSGEGYAKYNQYIGAKLFDRTPNWFEFIRKETLHQPRLVEYVKDLVENQLAREKEMGMIKTGKEIKARKKQCYEQIRSILDDICVKALPKFTNVQGPRFSYFFISQVLPRGYRQGMHISRSQVARLKAKAKELAAKKQSLVMLPCHKSHCDYIALVYIFFRIGLAMPCTIAGDNLDIPLVNWFLRQVGATFIKRGNWKDDPLYTSFFQCLMNTYLQQGMNIQCFIEGTRSRTGKLLPPKYGMLKFITEAIYSGAVEDCWIVPVSTQYDKALEADSYATELMGKEKKGENLMSFLESRSLFKVNLGRIDIRIGEGFSLREFVDEHMRANAPKSVILRTLAYKVLNDINTTSVIMPSALVGTVLLTTRQHGLSKEDLVFRVVKLIDRIVRRGGRIGTITKPESELTDGEIHAMVDTAIDVLGSDLVTIEQGKTLLEPVCRANDEFKLSYYRNQVVHLFVAEALVCICLYQHYISHLSLEVDMGDLRQTLQFLSRTLSGEFVFNNEDSLVGNLMDTLEILKEQMILTGYDDKKVYINPQEVRDDWMFTHFYTYLVWPFIDGYWSVAMTLQMMPQDVPVNLKKFYTIAQQIANTLYSEGALSHFEACNRQIIQSAVFQASSRNYVSLTKNTIKLTAKHSDLANLSDELALYRNEFMKRPSGSHLVARVEDLGKQLIQSSKL